MTLSLAQMAEIHRLSFTNPRPWSKNELERMLKTRGIIDLRRPEGFLMGRVIADEAEVLTLAINPNARRQGLARALLASFLNKLPPDTTAFLEVAADNAAAIALYDAAGFSQTGTRKGYYGSVDALLLARIV